MIENRILRNEGLARHTTLRIGGAADYFVRVESRDELIEAVGWGRGQHLDIFILGNGSNILVSDAGIRGLVIENHADKVLEHENRETGETRERLRVVVESGVSLPGLGNRLARQGWGGLEWAVGVPATVGAAIVTNAGAHGGEMGDSIVRVETVDMRGEERWWTHAELGYTYRTSVFKEHPNEYVVLMAELEMVKVDAAECIARMSRYSEHRRKTQPTEPSVGSMFKNPSPDFAGRLIDQVGLKGTRVGNVQVSQVHANFFVNLGGASSKDVMELIDVVKNRVLEKFGVELELEIQVVGE